MTSYKPYDFGKTLRLCENVFLNNLIFALFYLHKSNNIGSWIALMGTTFFDRFLVHVFRTC